MLLLSKFLQPARKTVGGLLFLTYCTCLVSSPHPGFISQPWRKIQQWPENEATLILCMTQFNVKIQFFMNLILRKLESSFNYANQIQRKRMTDLCSLPTSLTNRCTLFIVWQGLCTIPGKNNHTLIQNFLMQPSLVVEFCKVCTQFKEKPAVHPEHISNSQKTIDTAFISFRISLGLCIILGKTSYTLIRLVKRNFMSPCIVILVYLIQPKIYFHQEIQFHSLT